MGFLKKYPLILAMALCAPVAALGLLSLHLVRRFQPRPVAFTLFNVEIFWFSLYVIAGVLLGVGTVLAIARQNGESLSPEAPPGEIGRLVWHGAANCALGGLLGARLYHVFAPLPSWRALGISSGSDYLGNFYQLLNLRDGGLAAFGALFGGVLALYLFCNHRRLPFLPWLDVALIGTALGQGIGVWGNFFSQTLYGRPTALPWAVYIDPLNRLPDFVQFETFHPVFLYLSLWQIALFWLLLWLFSERRDALPPGATAAVYLIGYGLGRFVIEFVRLNSPQLMLGEQTTSLTYWVAACVIACGVALLMWSGGFSLRQT